MTEVYSSMENHSRFFPIVLSMYFPELRMELSNNTTKKSNGFDVIYPIWVMNRT